MSESLKDHHSSGSSSKPINSMPTSSSRSSAGLLTAAQMQAMDNFTGTDSEQDARRWWMKLTLTLGSTADLENYAKKFMMLFDIKLVGEAAMWADEHPEVSLIIQSNCPKDSDIDDLKRLFFARFRKSIPVSDNVDKNLEDLKQGPTEPIIDYYNRARRILVHICEDAAINGVARPSISKAEMQWVKTVINRFTRGMNDRWIGFQVEEGEPASLEAAFELAKDNTRKLIRWKDMSAEWQMQGYAMPNMGFNVMSLNMAAAQHDALNSPRTNQGGQPAYRPQGQNQSMPYLHRNNSGHQARNYNYEPPRGQNDNSRNQNNHNLSMITAPPTNVQLPKSDSSSNERQKPPNTPLPSVSNVNVPKQNVVPSLPTAKPRQQYSPPDPKGSRNQYVNGSAVFHPDLKRPLCVNCGVLGHISRNCQSIHLEAWEKEHLRALVFPESYPTSRSARLTRGGLQLPDKDAKEDDAIAYANAGYEIEPLLVKEEELSSRLSKLGVDQDTESKPIYSRAAASGADPSQRPIKPYKTVRIQDVLNRNTTEEVNLQKRKDRSGDSSQEKPARKKEKSSNPRENPTQEWKADTPNQKKAKSPRKKIADMTEDEKADREKKKNQKKQLKLIRGMMGQGRFDLAKALAETPCPISYLQYFQDSPLARLEMSRINSLSSNNLAAMFGDPPPLNSRLGAMGIDVFEYPKPHLGSGGAFMVTARIMGVNKESPAINSAKVCIDAGSEVDLATPSIIERTHGEVIDIRDTPWPSLAIRTSGGASTKILAIARIKVNIQGREQMVYACVISDEFAANSGYDILLGIPWLWGVKGSVNLSKGTVTIRNEKNEKMVIVNSTKFTPPNFEVMFDACDDAARMVNSLSSDEDSESSSEEEDSGEESIKSSDGQTPPKGSYNYPEIVRKYSQDTPLASRSTTLIIEGLEEEGLSEIARLRYVTAADYIKLYGEDGTFSHLAKAADSIKVQMEDESGSPIEEGDVMLIVDEQNRGRGFVRTGFSSGRNPVKLEEGMERSSRAAIIGNGENENGFPTRRRVVRRKINSEECPPETELENWARKEGVKLGPLIPKGWRYQVLCGLWTWRDLNATNMKDVPATDLIKHRVDLVEGTVPYATRHGKRLSKYQEHWLAKYIAEGMECGMYERTPLDEPLSRWSAPPVIITKDPSQRIPTRPEDFDNGPEMRLTFNYHNVHENLPAVDHPLQSRIHDLMSNPKHKVIGKGDLKHGYWAVEIVEESRHILAFNVTGIGQLRPTRMPQGCRSSSCTFAELGRIAFGEIPAPHPEPSLLSDEFGIFVDDMFWGHEDFMDQFLFLFEHFFPRLYFAMIRMAFKKLELFMESLSGVGMNFSIGGEIRIMPERVDKIMQWPSPPDRSSVRSFMGAIQICRRWVKNFTEIARPLTRLTGTADWKWGLVEETAFRILKNKCATVVAMFGVVENLPLRAYFDASGFAGGFALTQIVNLVERPLIYDSVAFNVTQRKYGTYKRELFTIVHFSDKYRHHFTSRYTAVFFTDHLPLVRFLNSDRHDGIYARWAIKLQELNFQFVHIEGKRNVIADGLSRTIFPGEEPEVDEEFGRIIELKDDEGDAEWFWKDGKGGYEELVKDRQLSQEGRGSSGKKETILSNKGKEKEDIGKSQKEKKVEMDLHLSKKDDGLDEDAITPVTFPLSRRTTGTLEGKEDERFHIPVSFPLCEEVQEWENMEMEKGIDFVSMFSGMSKKEGKEGRLSRSIWEADEWYREIYCYLTKGGITPEGLDTAKRAAFKQNADKFRVVEGNLFRYDKPGHFLIPCVLERDLRRILREAHDECGHYASSQIARKLRMKAWWPDRNTDIKAYIDGCLNCARFGPAIRSHNLQPTLTYKPFDLIGMDFIGPLPTSTNGYTHIFHVVDYFSRFAKAWPCKACAPEDAIHQLSQFFEEYPTPICVYSDQGSHFKAQQMVDFMEKMEVVHILSPSGASKSTGMIERTNLELENSLKRMAGNNMSAWDLFLRRATRAINTRRVVALGFTPFELLFGIQPRLPFELSYPDEEVTTIRSQSSRIEHTIDTDLYGQEWEEAILSRHENLKSIRDGMIERWKSKNDKMKVRYDRGVKGWRFQQGDLVMLYDNTVGTKAKGKGKLAVQWPGPYLVEGFAGDHGCSYYLKHIHGKRLPGTHHGDHLKLFRPRTGRLSNPFDDDPPIGPKSIRQTRRKAMKKASKSCRMSHLELNVSEPLHNQLSRERREKSMFNLEDWGIGEDHAEWAEGFWKRIEEDQI